MIRRWGFLLFFFLPLLACAGAWVGSYWWYAGGQHNSARTGYQSAYVDRGALGVITSDDVWTSTWYFTYGRVSPELAEWDQVHYQSSPYRFLGFAFDPDANWPSAISERLLIIPLWFPTAFSALGLLWAWRRKRRIDRTRRGGFEVQAAAAAEPRP